MLAACAPKRPALAEDETWRDFESKLEVRLDVIETLLDQGAVRKAETIIAQMRSEGEDTPELDYLQGRALYLQGMSAEAEQLLSRATTAMKRDARPHEVLGLLYADAQRSDEAVTELQTAVKLDENNAKTWNNLGFVLTSTQRFDEAVEALREAVRLDGTIARYRNNLGFALHASGHPADAMQVFKSTGTLADAHTNMAVAWELAGSLDEARAQYAAALESNPEHTPAKEGLARLEAHEESP
ncbi:MAG: tetratricopeptide repeat protein [Deltaproteobacteria bacterium]|nr:MAG: tetratricopeptide repeat protein [Deltaproteobacteria bacterium]